MSKKFMDPKSKILVAINFDAQAPRLLELARSLSHRTGLGIRIVHAVLPTLREAYPGTLDLTGAIRDAADDIDEANVKEARDRLYKYETEFFGPSGAAVGQNSPDKKAPVIERIVLLGQPAEAIIAEATLNGSALILCGAGAKHSHYVPVGLSTALLVMTNAPCAVLVQGAHCTHDLSHGTTKLMIADDLTQPGLEATITGLDFARALGHTDVLHMTVGPTSQSWFVALKERLALTDKEKNRAAHQAHEILSRVSTDLETKLRGRAPEHVELLATRESRYQTKVMHGRDVVSEVTQASKDFGADIMVYGRHRALHREPWGLGKVAWHDMLAGERLVLIASPH